MVLGNFVELEGVEWEMIGKWISNEQGLGVKGVGVRDVGAGVWVM